MNAQLPITAASGKPRTRDAFRVVIVCEDYPVGRYATAAYQCFLTQFGPEFDLNIAVWSFKILQRVSMDHEAVRDAVDRGDAAKRELLRALRAAFVTPLEPEDVFALSRSTDWILKWQDVSNPSPAIVASVTVGRSMHRFSVAST